MTLWRIRSSYFVAGLVVDDGVIVEAAPILHWTIGRPWPEIRAHMARRGWHGSPT